MKRPTLVAVLLAVAATIVVPAYAKDRTPADRGDGFSACEDRYLHLYEHAHDAGIDVGRNLVDDGLLTKHGVEPISDARACREADQLDVALNPPEVKPEPVATNVPAEAPAPAPTTSTVAPTSGGSGCVGMEAESGSAGYAATPSGPYIGCYQISADHYAAGGSCAGLGTDPAGQDACAGRICATEGPGAWHNPAGENPCGTLP